MDIFEFAERPVVKTGERPMKGKHGNFVMIFVRFVDGHHPQQAKMPRHQFEKLKPIKGATKLVWERVQDLIQSEHKEPGAARIQAVAEMARGDLRK